MSIPEPVVPVFEANKILLHSYFEKIGYDHDPEVNLETLREIHIAHTRAIPFENLNPFLRIPVALDIDSIQRKLIGEGRGGYCFEHNTLLMHALREIGFTVAGLAARVMWNVPSNVLPARGHMLLLIRIDDREFIADTGFGGLTLPEPLRFIADAEQRTTHEVFRLRKQMDEYVLEVQLGEWKPLYRFSTQEQFPIDYEVTNYYLSTNINSHFLHNVLAARVAEGKRYGLRNNELSIHEVGKETKKQTLGSVAELKGVLQNIFGITIPDVARIDELLSKVIVKN